MSTGGLLNNQRNQESALDHVFNAVITAIINGELKLGDKLPTETALSQHLGVGRNTVREAVKILEAYGVVTIHRPEGTFINTSYTRRCLIPCCMGYCCKSRTGNAWLKCAARWKSAQCIWPVIS